MWTRACDSCVLCPQECRIRACRRARRPSGPREPRSARPAPPAPSTLPAPRSRSCLRQASAEPRSPAPGPGADVAVTTALRRAGKGPAGRLVSPASICLQGCQRLASASSAGRTAALPGQGAFSAFRPSSTLRSRGCSGTGDRGYPAVQRAWEKGPAPRPGRTRSESLQDQAGRVAPGPGGCGNPSSSGGRGDRTSP